MNSDLSAILKDLRPRRAAQIMDLVAAAGIDVSPWERKKDGSAVSNPRANPQYCYEWAFGGDGEPMALCLWHESIRVADSLIVYEGNVRERAMGLDRVAIDRGNEPDVRSRARDQAKRARKFDSLLQRAFRRGEPVRAILLEGERRAQNEIGKGASSVASRLLDTEPWYVHSYRDDGTYRLVRSAPPPDTFLWPLPMSQQKCLSISSPFRSSNPGERLWALSTPVRRKCGKPFFDGRREFVSCVGDLGSGRRAGRSFWRHTT